MSDESKIKEIFKKALIKFKQEDLSIMKNDSSERAKVHRIAMYMENFIKEQNDFDFSYVVDCEYNLVQGDKKQLSTNIYDDDRVHNLYFYPDLIVHERNSKNNLFCCEFKNKTNSKIDLKKIIQLITDDKYKYSVGAVFNFKNIEDEDFIEKIKFFSIQNLPII